MKNPTNVTYVTIQQQKSTFWSDIHEPTPVKNPTNVIFVTFQQLKSPI